MTMEVVGMESLSLWLQEAVAGIHLKQCNCATMLVKF
jgi:hypothetical protein